MHSKRGPSQASPVDGPTPCTPTNQSLRSHPSNMGGGAVALCEWGWDFAISPTWCRTPPPLSHHDCRVVTEPAERRTTRLANDLRRSLLQPRCLPRHHPRWYVPTSPSSSLNLYCEFIGTCIFLIIICLMRHLSAKGDGEDWNAGNGLACDRVVLHSRAPRFRYMLEAHPAIGRCVTVSGLSSRGLVSAFAESLYCDTLASPNDGLREAADAMAMIRWIVTEWAPLSEEEWHSFHRPWSPPATATTSPRNRSSR